jgi:hypothetical protein
MSELSITSTVQPTSNAVSTIPMIDDVVGEVIAKRLLEKRGQCF